MLESEDSREALEGFQEVLKMEQEKGEWYARPQRCNHCTLKGSNLVYSMHCRGFKALKQIVKIYYKMGQKDKMMEAYR